MSSDPPVRRASALLVLSMFAAACTPSAELPTESLPADLATEISEVAPTADAAVDAAAIAASTLAPGYPPPEPMTEPGPTADLRPVSLETDPYRDFLSALQAEMDGAGGAALAARRSERSFDVFRAGSTEGTVTFSEADADRTLAAFFAAGSKPRIDGYFRQLSAGQENLVCLGVVTNGWQGVVPMPTESPGPSYGEAMPADFPPGWWGWRFCDTAGGQGAWWWDQWLWFGEPQPGWTDDDMRASLSIWSDYAPWGAGDAPSSEGDKPEQPTYYVIAGDG